MAIDRLKTSIWIQAQTRICGLAHISIFVVKKGDPDAGVVLLKVSSMDGLCRLYSQIRDPSGALAWSQSASGGNRLNDADADAYIEKQKKYDPDIWVVEVEDPNGLYQLDGKEM